MNTDKNNTQLPHSSVSSSLFSSLEISILMKLPYLRKIEIGQRFHSEYYGTITATKITDWGKMVYSIYGFDEKDGNPRDCYFPKDLKLLGKAIMLNDVLEYFKTSNYDGKVNMMLEHEAINGINFIVKNWDLSKPLLKNQSEELISWLAELL